ncbi:hypothetical protein [Saliniramus sp.]|uniref:hypothetical protein n=1 Tax=Saliniramus sp. TaxID=2986772 RepID=UPI002BC58FCD|nr:hypothetical protein [Saliniramus sp.]HMB10290.1 hypothetical protein [Saliniramus sp.]
MLSQFLMTGLPRDRRSTTGPIAGGSALRRVRSAAEYKAVTSAVRDFTPPNDLPEFWNKLDLHDPEARYDGFDVVPEGIYLRDDKSGKPVLFEASGVIYLAFKGTGNPAGTVAAEVKGTLWREGDVLKAEVTDLIPLLPE